MISDKFFSGISSLFLIDGGEGRGNRAALSRGFGGAGGGAGGVEEEHSPSSTGSCPHPELPLPQLMGTGGGAQGRPDFGHLWWDSAQPFSLCQFKVC